MQALDPSWFSPIATSMTSVGDEHIADAARAILAAKLVLTAGNGGSAALASHAAQMIQKPSYAPGGGRAALCLTDGAATLTAHANDGGWTEALVESARPFLDSQKGCTLFLISSSGQSENVVRLARLAASRARPIIALTGFDGEPLRSLATLSIHVCSRDYEVIEPAHDAIIHRIQYHLRSLSART